MSDAEGHSLGPETIRSGRNLDTAVDLIINNFHHENDYFKVSVCACMCVHRQSNQSINQSVNQINQSHLFAKEDFTTLQRLFAPLSNHVHLLIL